jgi:hypothetical protein
MAFRQLNQFPDLHLHPIVTRAIDLIRRWWPGMGNHVDSMFSQLIKSFPGVWDLLPPDDEEILRDSVGNTRSALHWEGWSDAVEVLGEITRQRYALYNRMFQPGAVSIPTALVVGSGSLTEYLFDYSPNPPYGVDFQNLTRVDGDGTVIVDSAEWLKSLNPSMPYLQMTGDHTLITQHPRVHQWVLNEIP